MSRTSVTRTARAVAAGVITLCLVSCASAPQPPRSHGIPASKNPQVIERGRYLVYGPAHCASCHGDRARERELQQGKEVPLSGGRRFDVGPLGTIVAPNITSDRAVGIGAWSDDDLVRSLRYGVSHSGRPLTPFMLFAELADRDLQAIVSFLRTLQPVPAASAPHDLTLLGSFAVNLLLQPQGPKMTPPADVAPERTAEYGRYLAHTVANCHGCHTLRSKLTGAFVGPSFAGGMKLEESGGTFVTPNLTPSPDGVVANVDEQDFVERFRTRAQIYTQSPMPWASYARMTDDDLGAIYRYLRTLPPAPTPQG